MTVAEESMIENTKIRICTDSCVFLKKQNTSLKRYVLLLCRN